jgi:cytochrome c oxidase subunit 2
VQRLWSLLFGAVLLTSFALFAAAPFMNWWLPTNIASFGGDVDFLYYVILFFTGFFFILTEVILVWIMWRFAHVPGRKSDYTHGNHRLEILWTIVPAAILLFIAFAQIGAWGRIKYNTRFPKPDQVVQVTARQWEWRLRYPADVNFGDEARARRWAEEPESDDVRHVNELHTWHKAHIKVYLKTQDVIHSLYFPNLRLKQDALPGKTIPVWFRPLKANVRWNDETKAVEPLPDSRPDDRWEFACAELCGARHYAMRGRLYVHESEESFRAWLAHARAQQDSKDPESGPGQQVAANE